MSERSELYPLYVDGAPEEALTLAPQFRRSDVPHEPRSRISSEDLLTRVRASRRKLNPHYKLARKEENRNE